GQTVDPPPRYLIGAVDLGAGEPDRLGRQGALRPEFVQTQFVFDVPAFAGWLNRVRDLGLTQRCAVMAGVGPLRSLRALDVMAGLPGVRVPAALERRLRGVPAHRVAEEGMAACA